LTKQANFVYKCYYKDQKDYLQERDSVL